MCYGPLRRSDKTQVRGWLFLRAARSFRIDLDTLVARALKNPPRRNLRRCHHYM
jgi:hypothetical protein